MARIGVTFDDISQAATKLLSMGESPSVQKVRELLGTGSNSTIAEHLKRWKLQRSTKEGVTLPEAIPKELIPPLETLWHIAIEQSDHRYMQYKQHSQQQIDTLTTERDTWREQVQTTEQELSESKNRLHLTLSQLSEVQKNLEEIQSRSDHIQSSIEKKEVINENLKLQLNQQKQLTIDREQGLKIEHQRILDTIKQQYDELKISYTKEQERSDASESRWLRVVDQAKDETKALNKKITAMEISYKRKIDENESKLRTANELNISLEKKLLERQARIDSQSYRVEHLNQTITRLEMELKRSEDRLEYWQDQIKSSMTMSENEKQILTEA